MKGFHSYFYYGGSVYINKDVDSLWGKTSTIIGINSQGDKVVPKIVNNTWYGEYTREAGYMELYNIISDMPSGISEIISGSRLEQLL